MTTDTNNSVKAMLQNGQFITAPELSIWSRPRSLIAPLRRRST